MNIDSLNLFSMLSSAEDDTLQPLLPDAAVDYIAFSEAMMETVKQLQGTSVSDQTTGSLTINALGYGKEPHELADIIDRKQITTDFSGFWGKGLPQGEKLEKEIDLENTLETLANVLSSIEENVPEKNDVNTKLDVLIENVKAIETAVSDQQGLNDKLSPIVEKLERLKQQPLVDAFKTDEKVDHVLTEKQEEGVVSKRDVFFAENTVLEEQGLANELDINEDRAREGIAKEDLARDYIVKDHRLKPVDERQQEKDGQSIEDSFFAERRSLKEQAPMEVPVAEQNQLKDLDQVKDEIQQVKDFILLNGSDISADSDLERKIKGLVDEIENIKQSLINKASEQSNKQVQDIALSDNMVDASSDPEAEKQITSLAAILREPKIQEKGVVTTDYQELKITDNKEKLSIKLPVNDRLPGLATQADNESFSQQENKPDQNERESIFLARQKDRGNDLDIKDVALNSEKVLPRIPIDIANLNRAVMTENKVEMPPMTKHFAHPEWNKEMGERIVWMHKQEIPSAELRLNPGHLGPIKIKVDVSQEQVTVAFTTQHAAVKEAIDMALPKLREMFSAQQINLADVSVSQEDAGQKHARNFSQMGGDTGKRGEKEASETPDNQPSETMMDIADEIEAGRAIASNGVLSLFA